MIIYPNYTFSVPDKWLYTLYKGITVTPRLVQASSMSSYGQATFTRGASCLCFVRRPFTRPAQPRVTVNLRQSQGYCSRRTFGAEPTHDSAPPALGLRGIPPGCAGTYPTCGASDPFTHSAPKVHILRDREDESCSCETTVT
jgi:hypothetical protein